MIKIPLERCIKSSHHTDLSLYSYHRRNTFAVRCHASYFQSGYDQVFSSIFYSNICSRAPRLDLPLGCPGLFAAYVVYEQLQNQLPFPWNKAVKCTDLVLIRERYRNVRVNSAQLYCNRVVGLLFTTRSFQTRFPANPTCISVQN